MTPNLLLAASSTGTAALRLTRRALTLTLLGSVLGACASAQPSGPRGPSANGAADGSRAAGDRRSTSGARPRAQARSTAGSGQLGLPRRGAAVGTPGPILVEAAGRDGRWTSVCQAREDTDRDGKLAVRYGPRGELEGDAMRSYFVLGAGPGEAIDGLAAYDPTGRYVVVVVDGKLWLIDAVTHKRTDLSAAGADARWDAVAFADHRALSFDPIGSRLAFVRADRTGSRLARRDKLVIMQLPSGAQQEIDPGGGSIYRIRFLPDGRQVAVEMVAEDTNKNGRLDWPVPEVPSNRWRCHGPITTFPAWIDTGDRTTTRVASVQDGQVRALDGWVAPLGEGSLVRDRLDQLWWVQGASRSLVMDAACDGRVLHVDPGRGLALVACTGEGVRAPVFLVGPGRRTDLELQVPATCLDHIPATLPRWVPLYPGGDTVVVDLDTGGVAHLTPGDDVVYIQDATAIVRRGKQLIARDCVSGKEQQLGSPLARFGDVLVAGSAVYVPPFIVRLSSKDARVKVLGRAPAQALGLSDRGTVLVPAKPGSVASPAQGPLRWVAPKALKRP